MSRYWAINCINFKGEDSIFYFEDFETARENFDTLCEKNKNQEEFKRKGYSKASWFDSNYNEYSTCINLIEVESPIIHHNEIIF